MKDFLLLTPHIVLALTSCAVLLFDVFQKKENNSNSLAYISLIGIFLSAFFLFTGWSLSSGGILPEHTYLFLFHPDIVHSASASVVFDNFSKVLILILLCSGVLTILLSMSSVHAYYKNRGEFYAILLLVLLAMSIMVSSNDLLLMLVSIEFMSLGLYVLTSFYHNDPLSIEGGLKYFVSGAFATAFLVYGISLIYGATGTINFAAIGQKLSNKALADETIFYLGVLLLFVGLLFKVSAVPFHFWAPDAYQGAPTSVTAFMASSVKVASFAAIIRLLVSFFPAEIPLMFTSFFTGIAIITVLLGNILALAQNNIKRMLAYSSIAHSGYILLALTAIFQKGELPVLDIVGPVLFYLFAYTLMTMGSFGVIAYIENNEDRKQSSSLSAVAGLYHRHPFIAFVMSLFLLSLAGIPPTIGFFGKLYLFYALIQTKLYGVAIIGILGSFVGVYYYLRVIYYMYMKESEAPHDIVVIAQPHIAFALLVTSILVVHFGLFPQYIITLVKNSLLAY